MNSLRIGRHPAPLCPKWVLRRATGIWNMKGLIASTKVRRLGIRSTKYRTEYPGSKCTVGRRQALDRVLNHWTTFPEQDQQGYVSLCQETLMRDWVPRNNGSNIRPVFDVRPHKRKSSTSTSYHAQRSAWVEKRVLIMTTIHHETGSIQASGFDITATSSLEPVREPERTFIFILFLFLFFFGGSLSRVIQNKTRGSDMAT